MLSASAEIIKSVTVDGLVYSISNNKKTITDYTGIAAELVIPATINVYSVVSSGRAADGISGK